ncbi:MAG: cytochrome c [Chitinophagaceae bacterium]|jgi:hypothetical protein|nr:cytochrome c [Chitinophagaceae bacterium]
MYKSILPVFLFILCFTFLIACSDNAGSGTAESKTETTTTADQEVHPDMIKPSEVALTTPLNATWVNAGKQTYDLKCQSCHKLTDERIVGPGWGGITSKREPAWIMNMITNVDIMLEKDPEAQKLLEQCLVRMPNQNVSKDEARHILEFMRQNDGVK